MSLTLSESSCACMQGLLCGHLHAFCNSGGRILRRSAGRWGWPCLGPGQPLAAVRGVLGPFWASWGSRAILLCGHSGSGPLRLCAHCCVWRAARASGLVPEACQGALCVCGTGASCWKRARGRSRGAGGLEGAGRRTQGLHWLGRFDGRVWTGRAPGGLSGAHGRPVHA